MLVKMREIYNKSKLYKTNTKLKYSNLQFISLGRLCIQRHCKVKWPNFPHLKAKIHIDTNHEQKHLINAECRKIFAPVLFLLLSLCCQQTNLKPDEY